MTDLYTQLVRSPIGKPLAKNLGLPQPPALERWEAGRPVIDGPVLFDGAAGGRLGASVARVLAAIGAEVHTPLGGAVRAGVAEAGLDAPVWSAETAGDEQTFKAVVLDATGIADPAGLRFLRDALGPAMRRIRPSGRVVVLGTPPEDCDEPGAHIAQRALEGFTRSVGKEVRAGATVQLVHVAPGAENHLESTLRFLLSPRSAYVSGQVVRVGAGPAVPLLDWDAPLAGKVALVTGASRGIGAAIAATLARDGAHVVGLDMPGSEGMEIEADITDADAPKAIAAHLRKEHKGVDVVVHNAGITRDRTLARMSDDEWDSVLSVNLIAAQRITEALLATRSPALRRGGRVVGVASISGIAGNVGQTNYATSKAGVIGFVEAMAPVLAARETTINAVAPGFIETQMTASIPFATREAGRRMNSLRQGGLPVDVAETIAWLASPGSTGVTGNVVRVCGQSLLGA